MAFMMSLVALAIDTMLPALQAIGNDLNVTHNNDNHLIISFIFIGLSFGQLLYGPLSDTIGRKKAVYFGFVLFAIGIFFSIIATSLPLMLLGRALQGFGLSAFRVVSVAIIRDQFAGDEMARIMSFIMTFFILIPMVAPLLGQYILLFGSWKQIFYFLFLATFLAIAWFHFQQKETLAEADRLPFTFKSISQALIAISKNRISTGYTVIMGFIGGSFLGFLNTSQQILAFHYNLGDSFPYFFAIAALFVGAGSISNGKFVARYGMYAITMFALWGIFITSTLFILLYVFVFNVFTLWNFMFFLLPNMLFVGFLFGNLNSIAMEPLGKMAGIGAAVIGAVSTLIMVVYGTTIGSYYIEETLPLLIGFVAGSGVSLLIALSLRKHNIKPL